MSLLEQKKQFQQRGVYDELFTPQEAIEMILDFIPFSISTIWECTATAESKIVEVLKKSNYNVITSHIKTNQNFLTYKPDNFDLIITNPPYSLKNEFLQRAFEINKPFMFLLPITALEGFKRSEMYRRNPIQLIIPNKRFNFKPEKNSSAWFATAWFTYKLNLKKDLNFVSI